MEVQANEQNNVSKESPQKEMNVNQSQLEFEIPVTIEKDANNKHLECKKSVSLPAAISIRTNTEALQIQQHAMNRKKPHNIHRWTDTISVDSATKTWQPSPRTLAIEPNNIYLIK